MVRLITSVMALVTAAALLAAAPPNIVWVTCEDMSPRLGCYGDATVPTPQIDRLAEEGVRYTRAFGTYGVCGPNRHTLIMGMYPSSTGAMAMRNWKRTSALHLITDPELLSIPVYEATPPPQAKCFTEYLRRAGYYCSNNSKTDYQMRTPITAWDESSQEAHWRNRPTAATPFFAVFNSTLTHESKTFQATSPAVVDPARLELPSYYPDTPVVREGLAWHYDNLAKMDKWVGNIMDELEQDGLLNNTIVFFFSDHGDGLPRAKRWVYDSGLQVPLIVRYPEGKGGTIEGRLVSFVDFAPSVLSLAGLPIPIHMEGKAFLGRQAGSPRRYVYGFRDRMDPAPETIRAVRDHRFKYVRNYRPELPYIGYLPYRDQAPIMRDIRRLMDGNLLGEEQWQFWSLKKPLEELYDTKTDPDEIHNLAADPTFGDKLAELREARDAWVERHGDLGLISESDLIRLLWPPDGEQPRTPEPLVKVQDGRVHLRCAEPGASIAYRRSGTDNWRLYSEPIALQGAIDLEVQAIRYGWKKSAVVKRRVNP